MKIRRWLTIGLIALSSLAFAPPKPDKQLPKDLKFLMAPGGALPWKTDKLFPSPNKPYKFFDATKEFKEYDPPQAVKDFKSGLVEKISKLTGDFEDLNDEAETLGATWGLPDVVGDYDPGIKPKGVQTTIHEIAEDLGEDIGTVLGWVRMLRLTDIHHAGAFFSFVMLAFGWIVVTYVTQFILTILTEFVRLVLRFVDLVVP